MPNLVVPKQPLVRSRESTVHTRCQRQKWPRRTALITAASRYLSRPALLALYQNPSIREPANDSIPIDPFRLSSTHSIRNAPARTLVRAARICRRSTADRILDVMIRQLGEDKKRKTDINLIVSTDWLARNLTPSLSVNADIDPIGLFRFWGIQNSRRDFNACGHVIEK